MTTSRATATPWLVIALMLSSCEREAPPRGSVRVLSSFLVRSSQSSRPVTLEVADYVETPHPAYFFVRPKSTLHFRISEDLLGGSANPSGGPQLNVFLNVNSRTGEAWSHCYDFVKHHSRCPGRTNRIIVIYANQIRGDRLVKATHPEITPEAEEFPLSSIRGSGLYAPTFAKGKIGLYGIVSYRGGWVHPNNPRSQLVEGFDTYSTNFFLYPMNYRGRDVKFVDCKREQDFCKAEMFYCDKLVKFSIKKSELGKLDAVARWTRSLITRFHIEKRCPGEPFRPAATHANAIRVLPAERQADAH